jgi:hypothetical protein
VYIDKSNVDEELVESIRYPSLHPNAAEVGRDVCVCECGCIYGWMGGWVYVCMGGGAHCVHVTVSLHPNAAEVGVCVCVCVWVC